MESGKVIFSDKSVRRQVTVTVIILLAFILLGQFIVAGMAEDYKKAMIEHDYAVAGYLSRCGVDNSRIVTAFTRDKTGADAEIGSSLLSSSGYMESMQNSLLPVVESFHQKFALTVLSFSVLFSLVLLAVLYLGEQYRDKQLETAAGQLRRFMDGDTAVRLSDCGEGSLSRLFTAINTMATSLTAHIDKEKQNRQFLKDTISDISHQLKTPLAALQMYNEIIRDEKTGNEVVESFTDKSRRELERMESLIQNLLKLARLDAGTIELEKAVFSLHGFLEKCIGSFATRAEQEGKSISLRCNDSVMLCFDETWLIEAVGNIIKNALDHTDSGDSIEISCEEAMAATEIIIRDNGAGIHPEDIYHIFKRFYRSRFSKDKQGVGIGLALSKAIVEKHGGAVTVRSELGQGAEFHLIFPKLTNL
ncbi:Sensor protein SrrB [Pelotomaculum sp. FP]|uniref:sensor histidine kinase n=1 Tax=Pelotomaculum sp. FP TaxID=261474 RepID=UPI0010649681|nr:HAMP domain-containing sensor histidine kinase [Pelotomaculum sp. FP]TEB13804.1 Sensor protein SrrB [Pelotomaculum sp. FP]